MAEFIRPSFAKGELAPELYGRVDTSAYALGLATARNVNVHTYGGVGRRNGTQYLGPTGDMTRSPRLIPFSFKTTDQYILEFGELYMRVMRNGGHVTESDVVISGATAADPCVITATSHGYSNGDEVYIAAVVGMTELNGNRYIVANKSTHTFEINTVFDNGATGIDSTAFTTYGSAGTSAKIYEIVSPFSHADLDEMTYTQSADVMTFCHKSYYIRELSRTAHTSWTFSTIFIGPSLDSPADQVVSVPVSAAEIESYRVTAIDRDTGEESLPAVNDVEQVITGATAASPVVLTVTSHPFADGDEIQIDNVVGMTELNGNRYIVANEATNSIELTDVFDGTDIDGSAFTAYSSAGIARQTFVTVTDSHATRANTVTWTAVTGAKRYAVYLKLHGLYGLLGETEELTFLDANYSANTSINPPTYRDPFVEATAQPGAVGYHQQRRGFGGSTDLPDTLEFSQTGNHRNFSISEPQVADDAIKATLSSLEVNEIRHMVSLAGGLLVFTSGAEWLIDQGNDSAFAPDTITQKPQSAWGAGFRRPFIVGNTVLFVEESNQVVRSTQFELTKESFLSANLGTFSHHLLDGFTIADWTYSHAPEGRAYIVRSDGQVLAMSYDIEQEVLGWTRWDTDGSFEHAATLRHGGTQPNDIVYFSVKRVINGNTVRFIETWEQDLAEKIEDAFYVDSGLTLDVPLTITATTAADPVVISITSHGLVDGDEVDIYDIAWEPDVDSFFEKSQPDQLNGNRYTVANKTTHTFEITTADGADIDGSAFNAWASGGFAYKAVSAVAGLEHLEGETLYALCNGNVVKNLTVTAGAVTLPRAFSRIHMGMPFISDVETLNIEPSEGTIQGYLKKIAKVTLKFVRSRVPWIGPSVDNLVQMKQRQDEAMGHPTSLLTGDKDQELYPDWNVNGRVFIRQSDPVPMTILAIVPSMEVGVKDGED